jgi:hypothetical protein
MLLLSGMAATGNHPPVALLARVPRASSPIVLNGTIRGTYHIASALGGVTIFKAQGSLTPVGHVNLKGSIHYTLRTPGGPATFSTKHGKIFADLTTGILGNPVSYTITGGTGRYAGATGSGEAIVTTVPASGHGASHGKVKITFESALA